MSKLRLRGSTSGFTEIQASAVAGDNTITLPATTGGSLVAADSSGNVNIDSGTLYVDATNNRVGIGSNSPQVELDVNGRIRLARDNFLQSSDGAGGWVELIKADTSNNTVIRNNKNTAIILDISGNEAARIDGNRRLLVGTTSARSVGTDNPSVLEVESTGSGLLSLVSNRADQYGAEIALGKSRGTAAGGIAVVQNNDAIGAIKFAVADGTDLISHCAAITAEIDGTPGSNDTPGRLVFSTTLDGASSPTERMRIGNNGITRIFDSSGSGLRVGSASAAGTTDSIFSGSHSATSTTAEGTQSIAIRTNGNIVNTNNSYGSISDVKLKENIVDANSQWDDLKALQVRNYNFKEGQTHTQIGLVAQEAELVSPGLVSESPDRDAEGNDLGTVTKSVNYSVLYMKAVKALQEAMERIEVLEQRLTDAGIA